jgi:hypothetical protein
MSKWHALGFRPRRTDPLIILAIKALKSAIDLYLEFDSKFGFKSIILIPWHLNSNQP